MTALQGIVCNYKNGHKSIWLCGFTTSFLFITLSPAFESIFFYPTNAPEIESTTACFN